MLTKLKRFIKLCDDWFDDGLRWYPITSFAIVLSFACVFFMQIIHDVMFDLPTWKEIWSGRTSWDWLWMLGSWVFLSVLWLGYLLAVMLLVHPTPAMSALAKVPPGRLTRWVARQTSGPVRSLLGWPAPLPRRRAFGVALMIFGTALGLLLLKLEPAPNNLISGIVYSCTFAFFTGLWLATGDLTKPARERWTRTLGLSLALLALSSVVGASLWWLIRYPWNPLTWRMYSLWAIVHVCGVALCFGALVDSLFEDLEWRALLAIAILGVALLISGVAVPLGLQPEVAAADNTPATARTKAWFDAVEARLRRIPETEPVIFVAAAGGGARAAMFATLVLEALERTPPHGSFGKWSEIDRDDSLADRVLFLSSVSGGSVASVHFALGNTPGEGATDTGSRAYLQGLRPPTNTLPSQLEYHFVREHKRLCAKQSLNCSREKNLQQAKDARECSIWERLCDPSMPAGFDPQAFATGLSEPNWPVGSQRFDEMATDFNAPLLRGVVLPGLERGQSMTRFWETHFRWTRHSERLIKGSAPLLLVNLTDVDEGSRMIAGFPQLPPGLVGDVDAAPGMRRGGTAARALSDLDAEFTVTVTEAVRMSANFPWGFDVPSLALKSGKFPVMLIDGGVLDNTGIDTYGALLSRLETLADPLSLGVEPELRRRSGDLLMELARRGVVLLEIDSGAKPMGPGRLARRLASVLLPIHSLSMSGSVRASQAVEFYSRQMQEILEPWAEHAYDKTWRELKGAEAAGDHSEINIVDARLSHVVYSLDTENLMTAWALNPEQKGKLLARFIAEDASQRQVVSDEFADLEGANMVASELLSVAVGRLDLQTFLSELSNRNQGLLRWEAMDSRRAQAQRTGRYDEVEQSAATDAGQPLNEVEVPRVGWVLLGYYRESEAETPPTGVESPCAEDDYDTHDSFRANPGWMILNFSACRATPPGDLIGKVVEAVNPLYLDREPPDEQGNFVPAEALLRTGAEVEIEEIRGWGGTGYQFARIQVRSEGDE